MTHKSKIIFLLNEEVRGVAAIYDENQTPTVFKTMDQSIKVDDLLVVESGTRFGFTTVKVKAVDVDVDLKSDAPILWVIGKVDLSPYNVLLEQEAVAIAAVQSAEKRKQREELRKALFDDKDARITSLALTNSAASTAVTE